LTLSPEIPSDAPIGPRAKPNGDPPGDEAEAEELQSDHPAIGLEIPEPEPETIEIEVERAADGALIFNSYQDAVLAGASGVIRYRKDAGWVQITIGNGSNTPNCPEAGNN
jgi:hypothetical protein